MAFKPVSIRHLFREMTQIMVYVEVLTDYADIFARLVALC